MFNTKAKPKPQKVTKPRQAVDEHKDMFTPAEQAYGNALARSEVSARNARRFAFSTCVVLAITILGIISEAHIPRYIPYIVEVDRSSGHYANVGQPPAIANTDAQSAALTAMVQYTIRQTFTGLRTVTPDRDHQNQLIREYVQPFLPGDSQATAFVNTFYAANNPLDLGSQFIVNVDVDIPQPIDPKAYTVTWTETKEDLHGLVISRSHWKGTARIDFAMPTDEQTKTNPLGIFFQEIHWNQDTIDSSNTGGTK